MAREFDHIVLVVDDEEQVGRAVGRLLKKIKTRFVYTDSGQAALDRIKTAEQPFSLIISDQRMPGMSGAEFLEQAKERSPDTIRFLLTGYADVDAVTQAVNKGAIHRYIAKPWKAREFTDTVEAGLAQYELIVENDRLFRLAKAQNAKLYALNTELKKNAAVHKNAIAQRDKEIRQLEKRFETGFENQNHLQEIEALLKKNDMVEKERLNTLYAAVISELYEQFQEIATRNGFEMPDTIPGE